MAAKEDKITTLDDVEANLVAPLKKVSHIKERRAYKRNDTEEVLPNAQNIGSIPKGLEEMMISVLK